VNEHVPTTRFFSQVNSPRSIDGIRWQSTHWEDIANSNGELRDRQTKYTAYTFVVDRTMYEDGDDSKNPMPSGGSTSGTYYNYNSAMVNLGEPLESDKIADGAGVPRRNFNYDPHFNSFDRLPPLTPSVVYLQQEVFKRQF
jgi:hypothetical protein